MLQSSRWLSLLFGTVLFCALPVQGAQQFLFGATGSNGVAGSLYVIDPTTAAATLVGPITNVSGGGGIGITGLAFHPTTGILYGITNNGGISGGTNTVPKSLVTINPATAVATVIGGLGFPNSDISFRSDNTLFGYEAGGLSTGPRSMTTISLTTGAATRATNTSFSNGQTFGGGLAFSPIGTLYLSATTAAGTLDTLDPATGARTTGVSMFGAPAGGSSVMNAMAFDTAGTLFAVNSDQNPPITTDYLVTINPDPNSGQVTQVGTIALPGDMDGLAFSPVQRVKTISKAGSTVTVTIDSFPAFIYQLQKSNTPDSGSFVNAGSSQTGSLGTTLTFTDASASGSIGFYRILITP